jgi:hypothetical protein
MHLIGSSIRKLVFVGLATAMAGLVACSDSAILPSGPVARMSAPVKAPSLDIATVGHAWGYQTTTFTLTAAAGTIDIGGFYTLNVPDNAVCTLDSPYGPGTWDSPCTTLGPSDSITVTATYGFSTTGPAVDFSPALRFSPSAQVTLSTSLYAPIITTWQSFFAQHPSALQGLGMYYAPSLDAPMVTDAAVDSTVVTHINLSSGLVWRRVKHFSGYNVATGQVCDPSPDDPNCVPTPPPVIDPQ